MKIAIYGGAFDPPHIGHVDLLNTACEMITPDKVIVIPTGNAPHKSSQTDFVHRLAMAEQAFGVHTVSDIENNSNISYTIDTLKELRRLHSNAKFTLIIGADMFYGFTKWKDYERILEMCSVFAAARTVPVSSSQARELLQSGNTAARASAAGLLPVGVYEYIVREKLYTEE